MKFARILALLLAAAVVAGAAYGQSYPTKPIRLIVPFPPGGGTDFVARQFATKLAEQTGWTIVVDNKAGASGMIGLAEAARANPDGYDIVMGQADNMIIAPAMQKNQPVDPIKELTPISLVATSPFLFMTTVDSKFKSLNDVVAAAKANPGKVTYGTAGTGNYTHLAMELLQQEGNFKLEQVPYKGAAPAMTDLMGGHIAMAALSIASGMPGIRGGKLRGLAVTSAKRSPALPDVPTVAESGFKDFEAIGWLGILAPNGIPPAVVARLGAEIAKVVQNPDLQKALIASGVETRSSSQAEFVAMLKNDTAKVRKIVESAGIKTE
ncbi:MAG: tripartite tricarboxylate transporter substrate binding protein [Burkholderiales bacterium]|nr:tripartite tricarboxylate transporter substrate binding protein [Burkholderiales bacterium]